MRVCSLDKQKTDWECLSRWHLLMLLHTSDGLTNPSTPCRFWISSNIVSLLRLRPLRALGFLRCSSHPRHVISPWEDRFQQIKDDHRSMLNSEKVLQRCSHFIQNLEGENGQRKQESSNPKELSSSLATSQRTARGLCLVKQIWGTCQCREERGGAWSCLRIPQK